MSEQQTQVVIERYIEALARRDFDGAAACLSNESFSYVGALGSHQSAAQFRADLERADPILKRIERRRLFVDGNEGLLIYNLVTTMPGLEYTRVAEWYTVKDGLIVAVERFFDALAYSRMFDG